MTAITLNLPHLTQADAEALNAALADAQNGAKVTLAVTYNKVTKSKPRIANEDYRPLLGATKETLIGTVKKVAVGKNGPWVLLDATLTRAPIDGKGEVVKEVLGWTAIKGEGIKAVQILGNVAPKAQVA